jgi:hypothetical protein
MLLTWTLLAAEVKNVPSLSQIKQNQHLLQSMFGVRSREIAGSLSHTFTLNSLADILRDVRSGCVSVSRC